MEQILSHFSLLGAPTRCRGLGEGHVNRTFCVETDIGRRYVLQRISREAFHDIPGLMENISAITHYIAARVQDPRGCLHLVPTVEGRDYHVDQMGEYWRVYHYVEDSICLQKAERPEDFYQSAVAFGQFQSQLRDFPAATLHETIHNFHNTPDRYRIFRKALARNPLGRARNAAQEIEFALSHEKEAGTLLQQLEAGELPLRVTHNDTKLNNVMLDARTREALCVIDLDTVMPGLTAYDFGDSIRFGASTAAEDETDLSRVEVDLNLYRCFVRGFLSACGELSAAEMASLPMGAKLMTLECGVRFLTDYLLGDRYFSVSRPEHNLDRARTQFRLVADTEQKWGRIQRILREEAPLQKPC